MLILNKFKNRKYYERGLEGNVSYEEIILESIKLAEKLRGDLKKARKDLEDHQKEFKQLDPKKPDYKNKTGEWAKKWRVLKDIENSTFSTLMTFSDIWSIRKSG